MGTITWPGLRRVPSLFSSEGGQLLSVGDVEEPITATLTRASSLRFWYGATIPEFLGSQTDAVVGRLAVNCDFALVDVELCVYATATLLFCWSSDHPLALVRLSKITGKILLLKKVSGGTITAAFPGRSPSSYVRSSAARYPDLSDQSSHRY